MATEAMPGTGADTAPAEITIGDGPSTLSLVSGKVDAFVRRWHSDGLPPPLREFLPLAPTAIRRLALVELIKVDLDLRWKHGQPRQVEAYVSEFPELAQQGVIPIDLILAEFDARRKHATAMPIEAYVERFPAQADAVVRMLGGTPSAAPVRVRATRPDEIHAGTQLDDFDLLTLVGEGAFARVFLARQRSMQRLVALKVSADHGAEPQTLAQLDHPHIVRVYDQRVLPEKGLRLLYMPYLPGGTLRNLVPLVRATPVEERSGKLLLSGVDQSLARRGEVPPAESSERARISAMSWSETVAWLGARLADALDYAHKTGVLHRDLKPANILLGADGTPRLADFNVSSCTKVEGAGPEAFFGGSLPYMSPEQLEAFDPSHARSADSLDGRADIYSLAITLWELLTGSRPFPDEQVTGDWPGTLAAVSDRRAAGVDLAQLPPQLLPGLADVLAKCLQVKTENRFSSAGELARQLDLCRKPQARRLLTFRPGLKTWVARHAGAAVLGVCLAVNLLASLFSIEYNRAALIDPYPAARGTFRLLQLVVNGTFFPICTALMVAYVWPVAKFLRHGLTRVVPTDEIVRLRQRSLHFGNASVFISFLAWFLSGFIFPITLHLSVQELPLAFHAHFLVSQTLCGLVAVSYPQFGVTFLVFRCIFPALLPTPSVSSDDVARLRAADRIQNVYLMLAASVPLLAVGLLAGIGAEQRAVLALLSVVGIAGFVVASLLVAAIRADRAALEELKSE